MMRFVSVTVLVAMVLGGGRVASAQATGGAGTLPNGATIEFQHLKVFEQGKELEPEANSDGRLRFFNLAHCDCARATRSTPPMKASDPGSEGWFQYLAIESGVSGLHVPVDFWVGTSCTDDTIRNTGNSCKKIFSLGDLDAALSASNGTKLNFNLFDVVNGKLHEDDDTCQPLEGNAPIYTFVSTSGQADTYDYNTSLNAGTLKTDPSTTLNGIDTRPPPLSVDGLTARPTETAIQITWKASNTNNTDVAYYQALCAKNSGEQAHSSGTSAARYTTIAATCPNVGAMEDPAEKLTSTPLNNDEASVTDTDLPDALKTLDPAFICGQTDSGTATSLELDGLINGQPYQIVLLAIDLHGNFTGKYFDHTVTPHLVTDFWEDLHDRGSKVHGGLCLLAEAYGDDSNLTNTLRAFRDDTLSKSAFGRLLTHGYYKTLGMLGTSVHGSLVLRLVAAVTLIPLVTLALLWHWLTLPGVAGLALLVYMSYRRRSAITRHLLRGMRTRILKIAACAAVALFSLSRANAGGYQPYWEDASIKSDEDQSLADEPGLVQWHVGIRVGPYVPDIDKQLGATSPGPYEQMFGGARILPVLDVDRFLWTGVGQLGIGFSAGYMQKTARAFAMGSDPTDPNRPRESGAKNTFRLLPLALTGTFRFTWFDDQYGVPLVPYVRGGLAYYVWMVKAPNGDLSQICSGDETNPMCGNKAYGGSLGVQGAIGLAVRAERVDRSAAISMRQSGLLHAGVYAELSLAKVDGFGSDSKLSVGDRTWFAGVDFEF